MKLPVKMLIKPDFEGTEQLIKLWSDVFGDEQEYINLIFNSDADIFVKKTDGVIVSSFYLLDCTLKFQNSIYKGKYLYAAATYPFCRKLGIMSELINEAKEYCCRNNIDFIALLPANKSLYDYYSRFGFRGAMHRFCTEYTGVNVSCSFDKISAEEYFSHRDRLKGNYINFSGKGLDYAISCLKYNSCTFGRLRDNTIFIVDADGAVFEEVLSPCGDEAHLPYNSSDKIISYSQYSLHSDFSVCEPYGMLCPLNVKLEREWKYTDIYMNIALD